MRPHLRYLRYVLLHKLYVFRAGIAINGWRPSWVWRLLVHDLSKFRPSEWRPYVASFYGAPIVMPEHNPRACAAGCLCSACVAARTASEAKQRRQREFNAAWLAHQHRNPHHWQHWILREDSGKTLVLVPPVAAVDEMVADWLGAGTKILSYPSFPAVVAETVRWYVANRANIVIRDATRERVHQILVGLARNCGLSEAAIALHDAHAQRQTLVMGGREGGLARVER